MELVINATLRPLYPPGKTRYPLYRRLGGPQGTMALGSTQPLTEVITRNISWEGG